MKRLELGLARRNGGLDGPGVGSFGGYGALQRRVGEKGHLGLEAGYYTLGRFAGTSTCGDAACREQEFSDRHTANVLHAGLLYDRGPEPGGRGVSFLAGAGYYYTAVRHDDAEDDRLDSDAHGAGITLGLGVPLARLGATSVVDATARFHGALAVVEGGQGSGIGSVGFLTLTIGIRGR